MPVIKLLQELDVFECLEYQHVLTFSEWSKWYKLKWLLCIKWRGGLQLEEISLYRLPQHILRKGWRLQWYSPTLQCLVMDHRTDAYKRLKDKKRYLKAQETIYETVPLMACRYLQRIPLYLLSGCVWIAYFLCVFTKRITSSPSPKLTTSALLQILSPCQLVGSAAEVAALERDLLYFELQLYKTFH